MGFFFKVEYNIFQLFNLFLIKRTIPKGTRILNSVASSVPTAFPSLCPLVLLRLLLLLQNWNCKPTILPLFKQINMDVFK